MSFAFRFESGVLKPVINFLDITTKDLVGLETQINAFRINLESFLSGKPSLDVLLWGERGCGKSSFVKAFANEYKDKHLRVVQLPIQQMEYIYSLYELLSSRRHEYFMVFFDDISFEEQDEEYRRFKSMLEGGLEEKPENIIFVATSNKRHLIKDRVLTTTSIYNRDEINEQMSLYARFGLIIAFRQPDRETYLNIVKFYMEKYGVNFGERWDKEAEAFAMSKGARSGRVAKQFVISKIVGVL